MLGSAPGVGRFSSLVARPYSVLDVALDFQAKMVVHVIDLITLFEFRI